MLIKLVPAKLLLQLPWLRQIYFTQNFPKTTLILILNNNNWGNSSKRNVLSLVPAQIPLKRSLKLFKHLLPALQISRVIHLIHIFHLCKNNILQLSGTAFMTCNTYPPKLCLKLVLAKPLLQLPWLHQIFFTQNIPKTPRLKILNNYKWGNSSKRNVLNLIRVLIPLKSWLKPSKHLPPALQISRVIHLIYFLSLRKNNILLLLSNAFMTCNTYPHRLYFWLQRYFENINDRRDSWFTFK